MTFGFAFKSKDFTNLSTDVRLLRGDNIVQGNVRWNGVKRFPADQSHAFAQYQLAAGDVVLAMDRPWIEAGLKYSVIRDADTPSLLVQRVARLRARNALDQGFLGYVIGSRAFTDHVIGVQTGSAVPHISGKQIAEFVVGTLPLIEEQRAIAATLGALDDKINSNRHAIDLIQSLSRSTYAAWRAAYPDAHQSTFGEFADVFGGATPKTTEPSYWDGEIAWATPTDITALTAPYLFRTARMITKDGLASTSAKLHPAGTIFMTSRATIGSFAVANAPAATNQGFVAVRPRKPEHRWFLFEEMRARVPEMLDRANGSTFMELSRGNFKLMSLGVPSETAIVELDSDLAPLHAKAAQLDRESSCLAKVRDTMLPELLSGRILPAAGEFAEELAG